MRSISNFIGISLTLMLSAFIASPSMTAAVIDDAADLTTQQAQERMEMQDMRQELGNIKSTFGEATEGMEKLRQQVKQQASLQEVHLIAKEGSWEVVPGATAAGLTYNGQQPGPVIRVKEGDSVKVILHNQLKSPTSLYFHGMTLPHNIGGLPRKDAGLVTPGKTYAFSFIAPAAGTYWYHPQIVHADQMGKGLYGAIVVEPVRMAKTYERDFVMVIGQASVPTAAKSSTYFTVNGKSAPAIPPLEVNSGERIRLRMLNASASACPISLTGHRFEVVSTNGSDGVEPHLVRDTLTLQPGDRYDLEFTANNPGVWSLASLLPSQTNNDGKFPGGIAVVVRYPDALAPH